MGGVAHGAVVAVATLVERRVVTILGITVVALDGLLQLLRFNSQLLGQFAKALCFIQVAGLNQRIVVDRCRTCQTQAVAFHRLCIAK